MAEQHQEGYYEEGDAQYQEGSHYQQQDMEGNFELL